MQDYAPFEGATATMKAAFSETLAYWQSKKVDDAGHVIDTLDRNCLRAVQTPQAFDFAALLATLREAVRKAIGVTGTTVTSAID